jgi:hypothetical protein
LSFLKLPPVIRYRDLASLELSQHVLSYGSFGYRSGMSGLGFAVQIIRKYGIRNFELIEKSGDVGGTWLANTYPG